MRHHMPTAPITIQDPGLVVEALKAYHDLCMRVMVHEHATDIQKDEAYNNTLRIKVELNHLQCEHQKEDELGTVRCDQVKRGVYARYCAAHDVVEAEVVGGAVYASCNA